MNIIKLDCQYEEYADSSELNEENATLIEEARKATNTSYAPYSEFFVGAALRLSNGIIVQGSNQENSAYPSGLCAERVALFSIGSHFPDQTVESLAVVARSEKYAVSEPVYPCGACLQVMSETEQRQNQEITVLLSGSEGKVFRIKGLKNLLPLQFKLKSKFGS